MFSSDQPIMSKKQDILGRTSFSEALGEAILSYDNKDCLVVGLFGAWGSGKTSIVNLMEEQIRDKKLGKGKQPIIIHFNPWNFSDQNQLVEMFFKQLTSAIKKKDKSKSAKKIGTLIEKYSDLLTPLEVIPGVGTIAFFLSKVVKSIGRILRTTGELSSKDAVDLKKKISDELSKLSHKIIVIIDDIDRLQNFEIRQIFQVVKALADFPNLVYLLTFDKQVVTEALKDVQKGDGDEYLSKIIQVPFDIPALSSTRLQEYFLSQLEPLIGEFDESDTNHFRDVFHAGLKYLLHNFRDVHRLVNTFRFVYSPIRNDVNVVDLLTITAIQVFINPLYQAIKENKSAFTSTKKEFSFFNNDHFITREEIDRILSIQTVLLPDKMVGLITALFPNLKIVYNDWRLTQNEKDKWRRYKNICSPAMFDRYFRFYLEQEEISDVEINNLIDSAHSIETLTRKFRDLMKDRRFSGFLEELFCNADKIPIGYIKNVATVMSEIIDSFPENKEDKLYEQQYRDVTNFLLTLIMKIGDPQQRAQIIVDTIENTKGSMYLCAKLVFMCTGAESVDYGGLLSSEQKEELEQQMKSIFAQWIQKDKLKGYHKLAELLQFGEIWASSDQLKQFYDKQISTVAGIVEYILRGLPRDIQDEIIGGKIVDRIKKYINIQEVLNRKQEIFESEQFEMLSEQDKSLIHGFFDVVDKHEKKYELVTEN